MNMNSVFKFPGPDLMKQGNFRCLVNIWAGIYQLYDHVWFVTEQWLSWKLHEAETKN